MNITGYTNMAFNIAGAVLPGTVKAATVTKVTGSVRDQVTGAFTDTTETYTGSVTVTTRRTMQDIFPALVAGPSDVYLIAKGFSSAPAENNKITFGGVDRNVSQVGDIVGSGSVWALVVQ